MNLHRPRLTATQFVIAFRLACSHTVMEIAEDFGVTQNTIYYHLHYIKRQLGFTGNVKGAAVAHLVRWAWTAVVLLAVNVNAQVPTVPQLVSPVTNETVEAHIAWQRNPNATAYRVFMGTNSGSYQANTTLGDVTNYTWQVTPGQTYYFAAKAQAGMEESDFSNAAVFNAAPGPVVSLTPLTWLVSWTPTPGRSNTLQRRNTLDGEWLDVATFPPGVNTSTQPNQVSAFYRVRVLP